MPALNLNICIPSVKLFYTHCLKSLHITPPLGFRVLIASLLRVWHGVWFLQEEHGIVIN